MQPEDIVLIPPTHEISTPSFHVKQPLCGAFMAHLEANDIRIAEEPRPVGGDAPAALVEVRVEADTPMRRLEELLSQFGQANASRPRKSKGL